MVVGHHERGADGEKGVGRIPRARHVAIAIFGHTVEKIKSVAFLQSPDGAFSCQVQQRSDQLSVDKMKETYNIMTKPSRRIRTLAFPEAHTHARTQKMLRLPAQQQSLFLSRPLRKREREPRGSLYWPVQHSWGAQEHSRICILLLV